MYIYVKLADFELSKESVTDETNSTFFCLESWCKFSRFSLIRIPIQICRYSKVIKIFRIGGVFFKLLHSDKPC